MQTQDLFYVGFYSPSAPGMVHIWRPKNKAPELVSEDAARERFKHLATRMAAGKKVDGLAVASVAIFTEEGEAIRSRTADGTEAHAKPEDAGLFLQTAPIRGSA